MSDAPRPKQHLIAASRLYPGAWRQAKQFRAERGRDGLPDWPDWCYLPMAGWYAIGSRDAGVAQLDHRHLNRVADIGRLAALGTWRVTQGIYRFDPELSAALIQTPINGDLPSDLFYRLPEWCVYIETPGQRWHDLMLHGFFSHLEWDANTGRTELRLVLDSEAALQPLPVHIGPWSLDEAIRRMATEAKRQSIYHGASMLAAAIPAQPDLAIAPLIALLLYLCSENAEMGDGTQRPANPMPKKTRHGLKLFAPDKTRIWDVGLRIGAALRRGRSDAPPLGNGTHASPRPHIRRAHWHGYWTGPKDGERRFILKWIPPTLINATTDELPTVIHPVKP